MTAPVAGSLRPAVRVSWAAPAPGGVDGGGPVLRPPVPGRIAVRRPLPGTPRAGSIDTGPRNPQPTPGRLHTGRVLDVPRPGRYVVERVSGLPTPGSIRIERLRRIPGRPSIDVPRVRRGLPTPGSLAPESQPERSIGATGLGTVAIADPVIAQIASRAVLDVPDAGGVAPSVIGKIAGGHLGVRETSLDSIPKTTASVDGTRAFVTTTVSVRWPAPIAATAEQVRSSIRHQVGHMAGVEVTEVEVRVDALIKRAPRGPRVQ